MKALIKLDVAKTCTRRKGKSVASVLKRGNMLHVRKRINGKLVSYTTGKTNTEKNLE